VDPTVIAALAAVIGAAIGALLGGLFVLKAAKRQVQVMLEQSRGDVNERLYSQSLAILRFFAEKTDAVGRIVALVSVLILAGTFIFSVVQYRRQQGEAIKQQQLDQLIRIQTQIRNDADLISHFPKDKNMTISGAEFLLRDLDTALRSKVAVDPNQEEIVKSDRSKISEVLYDTVYLDSSFDDQRDAQFSIMVFESWEDYSRLLNEDHDRVFDLLAVKYLDKIKALRGTPPQKYIAGVTYSSDAAFQPVERTTAAENVQFRLFEDLARGYKKYLRFFDSDWKTKSDLIMRFQATTCNRDLTQAYLGWSVKPEDKRQYSDWFAECP